VFFTAIRIRIRRFDTLMNGSYLCFAA
jgi:hypothetical protein